MKKFNLINLALVSMLSVFCFSCNQEEALQETPTPTPTPTNNPVFTATIDGQSFVATKYSGLLSQNGKLTLIGKASDGRTIMISFNDLQTGTYTISSENCYEYSAAYMVDSIASEMTYSNTYIESNGFIKLTSVNYTDSTVTGTFSFEIFRSIVPVTNPPTYESVTISNGVFTNIPFTKELPVVPNNEFSVEIDGTVFSPPTIVGTVLTSNNSLMLNATDGSKTVAINIPVSITTGTYTLSSYGTMRGIYSPNSTTALTSSSGSLVITTHDTSTKNITGKFNFIATDYSNTTTATLNNGSFNITYN